MNEPISGALDRLTTEGGRVILPASRLKDDVALGASAADGCAQSPIPIARGERRDQPVSGALVKLTSEGRKVILALPGRGRALVQRVPQPVQIELRKLSSRGAHVCREIFAGILVVGLVAIVLGYGRLGRGPISLQSLVPTIEAAINGELSDVHVKIDDAILQRAHDGPGVLFRLRNIRLVDKDGSILAQAPFAAIGMSGSALLSGRIAPGSVDFIGPRLLLFYDDAQGLSLSFSRPAVAESEAPIRGSLPAEGVTDQASVPPAPTPGTAIAKRRLDVRAGRTGARRDADGRGGVRARAQRQHLLSHAVRRQGCAGRAQSKRCRDLVAGAGLLHRSRASRTGVRAFSSAKPISPRAKATGSSSSARRSKSASKASAVTALIENLVPSGIAGNFSSLGILKALDMVVNGETTVELSNSGEFLSGEAKLDLESGQITPPWDPDSPLRIDRGELNVSYLKEKDVVEIAPSTLSWGGSKATFSGEFRPVRASWRARTSWNFTLKADPAVLAVEEFGLTPMKVDEWQVDGQHHPARRPRDDFAVRHPLGQCLDRACRHRGRYAGRRGSPFGGRDQPDVGRRAEAALAEIPRRQGARAGCSSGWRADRFIGGKFAVNLGPADVAKLGAGGELPAEAVNVELNLSGMSIAYIAGTAAGADQAGQADRERHGVCRRYPRGQDRRAIGAAKSR